MAIALHGPKFYAQDDEGKPLAGGKVYTYQAYSNNPKKTWQEEEQLNENTNPVILSDAGYADIYLDGSYKIVVTDSSGTEIWTEDPVTDLSRQVGDWGAQYPANQYSATEFEISGDYTGAFSVGRRLRLTDSATLYGTVTDAQYISANTRVTVDVDGGTALTNALTLAEVAKLDANQLPAYASDWQGTLLRLGDYRIWVDATGALRIKSGAPASDTDGTVVGLQS